MYILKNAWKNLIRNKGRNILLGVIILAIIATSSVALIINNTAGGIIDNYKQRFSSEVTLSPNMQKLQENAMANTSSSDGMSQMMRIQMPEISAEQYLYFGDSDYLDSAQYDVSVSLHNSDDITPVDEEKGGGSGRGGIRMMAGPNGNVVSGDSGEADESSLFYAKLLGYNYEPQEFKDGTRQLADGKFPENDNECIVSRDLFESSGLKIGDVITLTSTLSDSSAMFTDENIDTVEITYTLTIVGYYEDITDEYSEFAQQFEQMQNALENRRNEIITTALTVVSQMQEGFSGIRVEAAYYLKNPADLEPFAAELYAKGLDEVWDVSTDEMSYNTIVKPVMGLKSITYVFLAVVLILGAIILLLLSSLAIRERKYEIGVLRAMGMKKGKVAFGLLSEVVTIALVCLVIGLGVGIVIAQPVSDALLANQLQQIEQQGNDNMMFGGREPMRTQNNGSYGRAPNMIMGQRIGGRGRNPAEALKEMDISMSVMTIIEIIIVSLGLAIVASIVGIAHITKYEPIRILSERT